MILRLVRYPLLVLVSLGLGCSRAPAKSDAPKPNATATESAAPEPTRPAGSPLHEGDPAPRFAVTAHNGEKVSLDGLRGKVVVLYFYPKDGTPGCTVEAEEFRDEHSSFQAKNAIVLGVSSDSNDSHADFAKDLGLPFLLLPDESGAIRSAYGVGSILGFSSRVTFIIDREGKIAKVYPQVDPKSHAREVLRVIDKL